MTTDEVVIIGEQAASPPPPASPPPSLPPPPPRSPPLPPPPAQQGGAPWPPCDGTHAARLQGGNQPPNRPPAADFSIRNPASLAVWLPQPVQRGLHTAPGQPAPPSIFGAPAGITVWPAYAQGVWAQQGLGQDGFFRLCWQFVNGRREGRPFKSVKLTPAMLASAAAVPPALSAPLLALSGSVLTDFYKPGLAEVRYVRLVFGDDRMQSSWHTDPTRLLARHLQYFFAPVPGCYRAVQLAMSHAAADANQPVLVAMLGNGDMLACMLSLRVGNGLGTAGADIVHMGMSTPGCAGVWQLMVQTNVQLSAEGERRCGHLVGEEAQLGCARLHAPAPAAAPLAVATVQPETSRLITACVSSTPGFVWWGSNWAYYGGDILICRLWLTETLPCIQKVEQMHPGLLTSQKAYTANYRGDQVEAAGCACALPAVATLVAQAKAERVWHGYEWSSYAVNPA